MKFSVDTKDVMRDLKVLMDFDINAYGRVAALIRALNDGQNTTAGQDLVDQLNMQDHTFHVSDKMVGNSLRIVREKEQNRNIWRLKLWRIADDGRQFLEPYRVIYGFFPANQYRKIPEIRLFAVPCRAHTKDDSYDYKADDPISVRVRTAYDAYE